MTAISKEETLVSSNGLNPSVIKLANANFIIAYQKNSNVAMKIFDSYGSQIGDEFNTATGCLSSQYPTFAIAPISVGGFAVACISGGLASIHVSFWDNNGKDQFIERFPYNPSLSSTSQSSLELFSLSMVGLNNGNFALSWSSRDAYSSGYPPSWTYTTSAYSHIYDSIGNDIVPDSVIASYSIEGMHTFKDFFDTNTFHANTPHTHIGQINGNNMVIAYKYNGDVITTYFNEWQCSADRFALALTTKDSKYIIASENKDSNQNWQVFITYRDTILNTKDYKYVSNGDHNINPAITILNNGNIAVTWHMYNAIDGLSQGIFLQIYDTNLKAKFNQTVKVNSIDLSDKFDVNNYKAPSITSVDQGFVITWEGNTEAGNNIYFMKFDNEGNKINPVTTSSPVQENSSAEEAYSSTNIFAGIFVVGLLISILGCVIRTAKFGPTFNNHEQDPIKVIGMTAYKAIEQGVDDIE